MQNIVLRNPSFKHKLIKMEQPVVPSFAICRFYLTAPLEMNEGTHWGQGYNQPIKAAVLKKAQ
jgi:hypothetical protein